MSSSCRSIIATRYRAALSADDVLDLLEPPGVCRKRERVTPHENEMIKECRSSGMTYEQISRKLNQDGISERTEDSIRNHCHRHGIRRARCAPRTIRSERWTLEDDDFILKKVVQGFSWRQIAQQMGQDPSTGNVRSDSSIRNRFNRLIHILESETPDQIVSSSPPLSAPPTCTRPSYPVPQWYIPVAQPLHAMSHLQQTYIPVAQPLNQ